jgi:[ribosomal protein S5]-alanine N-acetyltransferase
MSRLTWPLQLATERLILRPQLPKDYAAWYAGYAGRLPQQYPYDEGQVDLTGLDAAWFTQLCQRHQSQAFSDYAYIFSIFAQATGEHLGHVDLSTIQRQEKQWANLGYSLHNQYWQQGFAKEAVKALLFAGFENLGYHRIEAAINLDNDRSIALAKSVGMQPEGIRRQFYYENGQWTDHIIYVILPEDLGLNSSPPSV